MNLELEQAPIDEVDLRAVLSRAAGTAAGNGGILGIERRLVKKRADWRGTRLFERITVSDRRGTFEVMAKFCRPATDLELLVYRDILRADQLGTAAYWGARGNEDGSMTLFLEFVEGRRLKRCDETGPWTDAARWLGRMHWTFSGCGSLAGLPRYDTDFYLAWAHRALESACRVSPEAAMQLRRIVSSYDKVARPLGKAERTLVHGEFYCTNIMVQNRQDGIRICPFDWETAAAGCGALDLAYLLRQKLGISDTCLNDAYREGWREAGGCDLDAGELQAQVWRSRIHELMFSIWAEVHHKEALPERILRSANRASEYLTLL